MATTDPLLAGLKDSLGNITLNSVIAAATNSIQTNPLTTSKSNPTARRTRVR
jgi:hypothetical protein